MTLTYRPPWSDEMDRLNALLGNIKTGSPWRRPRIWETPEPHRLAGAAVWSPPASENQEQPVEVRFRLQPRFAEPMQATEMLRDLFAEIRGAGYRRINVIRPAREPWEKILASFGLKWTGLIELGMADALESYERLQQNVEYWETRRPEGWIARNIEEGDWDFTSATSGATSFMGAMRLEHVWENRSQSLSCIVTSPSGPVGVLLASRNGMSAVLEFIGSTVESRPQAALVCWLALRWFLRRDHPESCDRVYGQMDSSKGTVARSLLRRFKGEITQQHHHFTGNVALVPT